MLALFLERDLCSCPLKSLRLLLVSNSLITPSFKLLCHIVALKLTASTTAEGSPGAIAEVLPLLSVVGKGWVKRFSGFSSVTCRSLELKRTLELKLWLLGPYFNKSYLQTTSKVNCALFLNAVGLGEHERYSFRGGVLETTGASVMFAWHITCCPQEIRWYIHVQKVM